MPPEAKAELDEVREELIALLRGLRTFAQWIGVAVFGGLAGLGLTAWMLIVDHVEQKRLSDDVSVMKPRVDRLWYREFPDSAYYKPHKPSAEIKIQ